MPDFGPDNVDYQASDSKVTDTTQSLFEDNNILKNITKHLRENNSDADNSRNEDAPSTLTTTSSTIGMTLRKKTPKTKDGNLLKKKMTTPSYKAKSNRLRKKRLEKLKEMKKAAFTIKSDVRNAQPSILPKNTYSSMRIHCPKCDRDLSLTDTIYVRSEPKNCRICKSRIIYGCKKCNKMYYSRCGIQKHIELQHGNPQYFECAHCRYKTFWKTDLKNHLFKKHGFVPNINVHSQLKNICEKIQFYCSKCEKELISEETANRLEDRAKYCKKCDTKIFFTCKRCTVVHKNLNSMKKHVKYCRKCVENHICTKCNFKCHSKIGLTAHTTRKHKV